MVHNVCACVCVCVCVCVCERERECVYRERERERETKIERERERERERDLQLYGIRHMVKSLSDSEIGNQLPPLHGLIFLISSKGFFICTMPQTGEHIP